LRRRHSQHKIGHGIREEDECMAWRDACAVGMTTAVLVAASGMGTPAAAASGWAGPYLGAFAGYGWSNARVTAPFDAATGFFYNWTGRSYSVNADGFFGGATLGYNWQSGALVAGLDGELGYLGLTGSAVDPNFQPGTVPIRDTVTRLKSGFYGALYGQLGVAHGDLLLFGKAGVAFLDAKASTLDPCSGAPGCGTTTLTMSGSKTMVGWSAGAGIAWAFAPKWSVKAEYAYFDFGNISTSGPSSVPGERYAQSIGVTVHTVKLGVNYRFGVPPMASDTASLPAM
jgi:outer membrane immunogenic protein